MSTELLTTDAPTTEITLCAACRHPAAAHDAISRRYCAATTTAGAGATSRDCICAGQ